MNFNPLEERWSMVTGIYWSQKEPSRITLQEARYLDAASKESSCRHWCVGRLCLLKKNSPFALLAIGRASFYIRIIFNFSWGGPSEAMANSTYEIMWRDAMGDLNEQLNVEGVEEEEDIGVGEGQKVVRYDWFSALMRLCFIYLIGKVLSNW